MSVDYKGLIEGNHNPLDIAKAIAKLYGGSNFQIRFGNEGLGEFGIDGGHYVLSFDEEFTDAVKAMRPWERKPFRIHRMMHIFTDNACASDYRDVTSAPMTYVSLGHWGQCKEIIDSLLGHFGGYVKDEAGSDEWEPYLAVLQQRLIDKVQAL